jgi:hypothetical protein
MTVRQTDRRGVQAAQAFQEADNLDAIPRLDHGRLDRLLHGSEEGGTRGEELLQPARAVEVSAGEAVTWEHNDREIFKGTQGFIVETLEHPNSITVGASGDRVNAALGAGVLEPAIDAAMAAQARNSIEKMLCRQLATAHTGAMRLIELSTKDRLQPGEIARFTTRQRG